MVEKLSNLKLNGTRIIYYSTDGATCIDIIEKKIVTSFKNSDYDEKIEKALGEIKNGRE